MSTTSGIVTLLSDFGLRDGYVAAMKGVILGSAPQAVLVDAGHDIPPQDVRGGSWVLAQYWASYPKGTVHVAVVDPGVGTRRHALLAEADGQYFVAPDNGLLSWVQRRGGSFRAGTLGPEVHTPGEPSETFHGRDIFAYAGGLLAAGDRDPWELTEGEVDIVRGPWVQPQREGERLRGEIVHIDHFGNAVTNISAEDLGEMRDHALVEVRTYYMSRIAHTYADVQQGEKLVLINAGRMLEIAVCCGSAAQRLDLKAGDAVTVTPRREEAPESGADDVEPEKDD